MASYIALMRKDPDSDYSVDFPDFPGCITAGDTLDQARARAEEALEFHVRMMRTDGDAIPAPSALEAVMRDPDNRDAIAFLVDLPDEGGRVVRVNITMPEKALQKVDSFAEEHGYTRSGLFAQAAKRFMQGEDA
jgi:predicted RNase H-like HicB family nuclease